MVSYRDWVVETSNTTGTGPYALSGSPPAGTSYFTFRQRYANGNDKVCFWVVNPDRSKMEKNRFGTLTYGSPDQLSRNVVESTNGDAPISWTSGDLPLRIYVVPDADAEDFAISMGLGASRPGILKFGLWVDKDDVAAGIHTLKLFDGADDITLGTVNEAANKFIPAAAATNFPPGHINGLTYGNAAGDTTNDIELHPGAAIDTTGVYPLILPSTITKRLDATWAAGDGQGGLRSGLSIANTDYFEHLIGNSSTGDVDAMFDTSLTSPVLPSGYDYFRPVAWCRRDSGAILPFATYACAGGALRYTWGSAVNITASNPGTSAASRTVATPLGVNADADLQLILVDLDGSSESFAKITELAVTDQAPTSTNTDVSRGLNAAGGVVRAATRLTVRTNISAQVRSRISFSNANVALILNTIGFVWHR